VVTVIIIFCYYYNIGNYGSRCGDKNSGGRHRGKRSSIGSICTPRSTRGPPRKPGAEGEWRTCRTSAEAKGVDSHPRIV